MKTFLSVNILFILCVLKHVMCDDFNILEEAREAKGSVPYDLATMHRNIGRKSIRGPDPLAMSDRVIQLSTRPRAFLYKGFLSHEECDHLISKATPRLERSHVTNGASGKEFYDDIRTSSGMFFGQSEDEVVATVEHRIAKWTFLPKENGEHIQVLRYEKGQKYGGHLDYFDPGEKQRGGNRYATVLMYLSDVEEGGETVFNNNKEQPKDDSWSSCGKEGLAVKPRKGDALLFFSMKVDGTPDEFSFHTACPVIKGVKWSATRWIHVGAFEEPDRDISRCIDEDPHCPEWASNGECQRNKSYMVGDGENVGYCRLSCGTCDPSNDE